MDQDYAPIPSLLSLAALHNHLVREGSRTQVALVVESGEPREVMHFSLLMGYGASAINPYLAIETLEDLSKRGYFPENVPLDKGAFTDQKHWGCEGALVIDARLKPHHAPPVVEDPAVAKRVDALAAPGGPLHGIL